MKQRKLSVLSGYWTAFTRRLHVATWGEVCLGCVGVLFAGMVLHLAALSKLIVAVSVLNKLFSQHATQKKVVPMLESNAENATESEVK
ncbi:hypothetical protein [Undibacterium sp. RuRC25W]|uniref:hypothetical protein n=1 Tax=Undibacterium sp. RuRC25W TaxID=3413047 RepID=UPI003BF27C78